MEGIRPGRVEEPAPGALAWPRVESAGGVPGLCGRELGARRPRGRRGEACSHFLACPQVSEQKAALSLTRPGEDPSNISQL